MSIYQYRPLELGHIRLVTLLPGEYYEAIRIFIDTVELGSISETRKDISPRINAESLKSTLPPNWSVWDTLDDEILFFHEINNGKNWDVSWHHPDPSVDPSLYRKLASPTRTSNEIFYEALSYTWRSCEPEEYASVEPNSDNSLETSHLRLGGNLACAMRHLRYPQKPRKLWIDAVCIDQSNLEERREQVSRMSSIYQNASRVVVWLGNGSEDSDLAMCKLAYLGRQVILTKDNWLLCPPGAQEPYWCEGDCDIPYSEGTWSAIGRLLERSWFSRIWIIQEIQLAVPGAVVQCGREHMTWSHFRSALTCLWNKTALPRPISRGRVRFIQTLSWTYYKHNAVSEILHLIKGRECFDKRDYVYGVLGLLPPEFQRNIIPSYKLTVEEVYTKLTLSYFQELKDLNILRDCQSGVGNTKHGLPSWVPDLSSTKQWTQPIQWHNAAGSSSAVYSVIDSHHLKVTGLAFAIVDFAEDLSPDYIDNRGRNILQLFGVEETLAGNTDPGTGDAVLELFCNTLAGGYLRDRHPDDVLPSLQTWKTEVGSPEYLQKIIEHDPQDESLSFIDQWVFDLIQKRVFFKTCQGSIGLGRQGLQKGDIVVVLLGCDSPLILRPAPDMQYIVIGECYLDELKDAAALLGPLPPNWQVQVYTQSVDRRGIYRFLNKNTGHIQDDDPRMSELTRNLAMGEESSSHGNIESRGTHGVASSRSETSPSQRPKAEVTRKSMSLLQNFILC